MKKDCVLINPPFSLTELYGNLAKAGNTMPSLGLLYLSGFLKRGGFQVDLIEAMPLGLTTEKILGRVRSCEPKVVGLTATTITIFDAAILAEAIKNENKDVIIVIGGPHISAAAVETMERFSVFDIGVIGEGEETLLELMRYFCRNEGNLTQIKGVIYREGGLLRANPGRDYIKKIDTLALPDWEALEEFPGRYRPPAHTFYRLPAASLVTSRGCPYSCTFCDCSVFGKIYRFHSSGYIYNEIEILTKKYGVKDIIFYDDTFTISKDRLIQLCETILKNKIRFSWACFGRVESACPEILKLMKKAGCWQIGYGIESGNQGILNRINKKISLDQVLQALTWTNEAGIRTKGFFILGLPGETRETIKQTIDFAKNAALDDFQITNYTPFPGSPDYAYADKFGEFDRDWKKMNMLKICFVPNGLTKKDLIFYQKDALKQFYLRPKIILKYLFDSLTNYYSLIKVYRGAFALLRVLAKGGVHSEDGS